MTRRRDPFATMQRTARPGARAAIGAVVTILLLASGFANSATAEPKAVVELFTSQGCSSCPPADRLLGRLAADEDVLALSLPVDYWDYLGWKDTLADPDHSARQRAYAEMRGDRAVYTPQAVVNGRRHVIGSDERAIRIAVESSGGLPVAVDARLTREALVVDVGAGKVPAGKHRAGKAPGGMATVWLVLFDRERQVPIRHGENRGKTITYHNVVRRMQAIGMWKGKAATFELPRTEIAKAGSVGCAILIQKEDDAGRPGLILGATTLERDLTKAAAR